MDRDDYKRAAGGREPDFLPKRTVPDFLKHNKAAWIALVPLIVAAVILAVHLH